MSGITQYHFIWRKGDTQTIPLTFYDSDGVAIDITGATVYFTVKEKDTDADIAAKIAKVVTTHLNPVGGETEIALSTTDTNQTVGNYIYDIRLKTAASEVYTIMEGTICVQQGVLQSIT